MKINLTKLLETSGKVRWINNEPDKNSSAYFSRIKDGENASSDRAYSFELEKGEAR